MFLTEVLVVNCILRGILPFSLTSFQYFCAVPCLSLPKNCILKAAKEVYFKFSKCKLNFMGHKLTFVIVGRNQSILQLNIKNYISIVQKSIYKLQYFFKFCETLLTFLSTSIKHT